MKNTTNITTIAQQLRALHEKTTPLKWFENEGDLVGDRGYAQELAYEAGYMGREYQ